MHRGNQPRLPIAKHWIIARLVETHGLVCPNFCTSLFLLQMHQSTLALMPEVRWLMPARRREAASISNQWTAKELGPSSEVPELRELIRRTSTDHPKTSPCSLHPQTSVCTQMWTRKGIFTPTNILRII